MAKKKPQAERQCEVLEDLLQEEGFQTSCESSGYDYTLRVTNSSGWAATLRVTNDAIIVRSEKKPGTMRKILERRKLGEYVEESGEPDFDEEEDVLDQMSADLDIPENDLFIKSSRVFM